MTSYGLLEAICNIDDELLMQSEITNKKNNLIKYISLSACAIIVVALVAMIGISNLSIDIHESVPDITASGTNVLDTPPSSSVIDISDSSVVDSQTEIENPAPPPFAYSGGDENAWFYEPLQPKIGHITASLSDYFQIDEFEKWAETVNVLYRKGENVPTEINDFLNVYAVIEYFDISDEQVKAAYEAEINMENEPTLMRQNDLDILLSKDVPKILSYFSSDESIVIGDRIYSPQWIYENTIEAYKNEGISPFILRQKYELYMQHNLTDEAKEYLTEKIDAYTNMLPQATGGSDMSFSRKFVDEVYNIQIASEIVGREECDKWVNEVYFKKTDEERDATPDLYQIVTELSISKEDMLTRNNEYKEMGVDYIADYIIEALYEDEETMKLLLMNPLALYYNKEIYTFDELIDEEASIEIPKSIIEEYVNRLEEYYISNKMEKYMEEDLAPLKNKYL